VRPLRGASAHLGWQPGWDCSRAVSSGRIVPSGNRDCSRWSSEATPPGHGPQDIPPRRGVAEVSYPGSGGRWHALPGCHLGGIGFPVVSLRSTTGYPLRCLRHLTSHRRAHQRAHKASSAGQAGQGKQGKASSAGVCGVTKRHILPGGSILLPSKVDVPLRSSPGPQDEISAHFASRRRATRRARARWIFPFLDA
jgi:hypothetical protein